MEIRVLAANNCRRWGVEFLKGSHSIENGRNLDKTFPFKEDVSIATTFSEICLARRYL